MSNLITSPFSSNPAGLLTKCLNPGSCLLTTLNLTEMHLEQNVVQLQLLYYRPYSHDSLHLSITTSTSYFSYLPTALRTATARCPLPAIR